MTVSAEALAFVPVCAAASQVGSADSSASCPSTCKRLDGCPLPDRPPPHDVKTGQAELAPLSRPGPTYPVLIPISLIAGSSPTTEIADSSPTPPLKTLLRAPILVVDDDPSILTIVCDLLTVEGYAVCSATNGAQALKVLERASPRLVLLDMQMPVLDGWGFARVHQARPDHVPVLVMTAAVNARRWASEIDAAGYINKPFELNSLLDTVERVLLSH